MWFEFEMQRMELNREPNLDELFRETHTQKEDICQGMMTDYQHWLTEEHLQVLRGYWDTDDFKVKA